MKSLWLNQTLTVFKKDVRSEYRNRFALNMVLAFVIVSMLLILYTIRADQLEPGAKTGLIWIIILFAALSALGRSFIAESDRQTYDLLRIYGNATGIYTGKLLYNFIFTLIIHVFSFIVYLFFVGLSVVSWTAFLALIFFGTAGLSSVATLTAAIVSQADRRGAIFSVMSIPLFVPLILLVSDISKDAFISGGAGSGNTLTALVGFVGVTITAGILLFDYIWEE